MARTWIGSLGRDALFAAGTIAASASLSWLTWPYAEIEGVVMIHVVAIMIAAIRLPRSRARDGRRVLRLVQLLLRASDDGVRVG